MIINNKLLTINLLIFNSIIFMVLSENQNISFENFQNFMFKFQNEPNHIMFRFLREKPKSYIEKAVKLFKERNGKTIIEIGSMRYPIVHDLYNGSCMYCMDGHSTLFWGSTNAQVYTIDISQQTIEMTKIVCKDYKNVVALAQDGIEFLKQFNQPIDLLYLDAWDVIPGTDYAEKHFEAYQAAKKNLHDRSMILIDDTDIENGGKGKLVVPKAIEDGYKIEFFGRQTLLIKK